MRPGEPADDPAVGYLGLRPEVAAVSTIMLVLTLVALGVVALVLRRAGDSSTQIARTLAGG